ncbi:MAG TPA: type II CAAX endopeptidase family protein [Candidatus Acidoferrum sp.]
MNTEADGLYPPNDAPETTNSQLPIQQPPSTQNRIFFGADGLRAGWSLLMFVAMLVVLIFVVGLVARKLVPPNPTSSATHELSLRSTFLNEAIPFLVIFLVTWVMSKIERRPNSVYGLGGQRPFARFFAGLGWGAVCLSLLILTLWKTGHLVIDSRLLFGGSVFSYGTLWLIGFLLVGLFEEYLTRGYLQYTLTRGLAGKYQWAFKTRHSAALGFWTAALVFSVLFGLGHGSNPGESPIGLLSAGLVGFVFCLSLWRTGSLWWAIGFHASWDWAQSYLYGVADSGLMVQHHLLATHPMGTAILSGGTTGPEGSIFILAVLFIIALIIIFTLPRTGGGYAANLPANRVQAQQTA